MEEPEKLTLENLYGGAAIERFQVELDRCLENIKDINTTAGARKVSLTLTLKPLDEHRHMIGIGIDCKSSICAVEPIKSNGLMKIDSKGRAYIEEQLPNRNQQVLPGMENVRPFAGKGSD